MKRSIESAAICLFYCDIQVKFFLIRFRKSKPNDILSGGDVLVQNLDLVRTTLKHSSGCCPAGSIRPKFGKVPRSSPYSDSSWLWVRNASHFSPALPLTQAFSVFA
ncbi:MAG: hypothetical protein Ct9H300mP16_11210 [Pseudomonadota bacterium]|nr:MAG: hypothetical protein Ct9H300mP16_11210 [Pseudomonadota bacterium]